MAEEFCSEHSGIKKSISSLEEDVRETKEDTKEICHKLDAIKTWIIGLTGSFALAVLLLLVNILAIRNGS